MISARKIKKTFSEICWCHMAPPKSSSSRIRFKYSDKIVETKEVLNLCQTRMEWNIQLLLRLQSNSAPDYRKEDNYLRQKKHYPLLLRPTETCFIRIISHNAQNKNFIISTKSNWNMFITMHKTTISLSVLRATETCFIRIISHMHKTISNKTNKVMKYLLIPLPVPLSGKHAFNLVEIRNIDQNYFWYMTFISTV